MLLKKLLLVLITALSLHCAHANEEKIVNFYNWADYVAPDTIANFEKEYGIKVNYDIYDTTDIVDAKLLAGQSGYDLVLHSSAFSARLIKAGIFQALDRSKLTNWHHLDPDLMNVLKAFDPGNRFAAPYMWGTTGIAFNIDMLKARIPEVSLDNADFFFRPEILSRIADCGVSLLDGAIDALPSMLIYLGHHGNSVDPGHLKKAEQAMKKLRPFIKYFSSGKMLIDMPNKEVCAAMSWSGDYSIAKRRAQEAGIDINLGFAMTSGAVHNWFDTLLIPADAPHSENAHLLINYLLRPDVIADISNFTGYANGNLSATPLVDKAIKEDPAIYPDADVKSRLQPVLVYPPKIERARTRAWTRIKTGI
ncbi:MAG: extracellular solute-binding protein [Gammaproteobacteria bacterium]|nr:extracellular solute-binding protein [Gammaproteobacteria bacterium]